MNIIDRARKWLIERQHPQSTETTVAEPEPEVPVMKVWFDNPGVDRFALAANAGHPGRFWVDEIAEPLFGLQIGPGILVVHHAEKCAGRQCVIHNPSNHHMVGWPMNWRSDRSIMERVCVHGMGHPDPDDVWYHQHIQQDESAGEHGCDGCCARPKVVA